MPRLTISLFGTPQIEVDGAAIRFDRNKPIALVAYLALTGRAHPRSALALLLWPESANARTHLRSTLMFLRGAFGADAARWLADDRDAVALRTGGDVAVDALDFRAASEPDSSAWPSAWKVVCRVQAGGGGSRRRLPRRSACRILGARCAGVRSLADDRARVAAPGACLAVGCIGRHARAAHEWDGAIAHAQRWLALDPSTKRRTAS